MHEDLFVAPVLKTLDDVLDRTYSQSMLSATSYRDGLSAQETLPPLTNSSAGDSGGHMASSTLSTINHDQSSDKVGDDYGDKDDQALRHAEDEALHRADMLQTSESLPHLDNYGMGTDSFFLNQSKSSYLPPNQPVTLAKFPYISKTKIRSDEMNPKPKSRKLRDFPNPQLLKYTTRKF